MRALLEPHLPGIWSICLGFRGDEEEAIDLARSFQDVLGAAIRGFAPDRPFGLQLYAMLWRHLAEGLEPPPGAGIPQTSLRPGVTVRPPAGDDERRIREVLAMAPPLSRLLYLFWLVTDLDAGRLATLSGLPEAVVRAARADLTARLQEGLSR